MPVSRLFSSLFNNRNSASGRHQRPVTSMPWEAEKCEDDNEPTFPCRTCGRNFIKSSLEKHEPVCKKLAKLNRKPFDSGKQRATGSDITIHDVRRAAKEKQQVLGGQFPRPKTQWKERHENFIEAVSSSKKVDYAIKTGAPLPPPPKTSTPSDYVHCPCCGRSFSAQAAERHIPFCKEQAARKGGGVRPIATRGAPMTAAGGAARPPQTRGGAGSRESSQTRAGRDADRGTTAAADRIRSLESRSKTTRSATQHTEPQPSTAAAKRSNSAPRNPSRLKTPQPVARRSANRVSNTTKQPSLPPKTPKTP
ncbi:hypothetical protein PENTCL1PPCAC_25506 [Pristionchus entomophagus]|uniref:C2HC/C3H-type domain-containing protein n=1 Tax=Pristionchus entomophagus TaxID=358040 RepID=A0AAV5U9U9_9BILA|nr:hypothetical protein PENTCL1PPCAC_25506 [Pristionchus entomophagus]